MLKATIAVFAMVFTGSCLAELKVMEPQQACASLAEQGLPGRKWTDYEDGTSGCASNYKDIGQGSPLANNLAFYVTGAGHTIKQAKLVLNFNQPENPGMAISALGKAAELLIPKMLGAPLPNEIRKAIVLRKPASISVGSGIVELVRDDWPTGKGYEVQVIVR